MKLTDQYDNGATIECLVAIKPQLVLFIGAGFSQPACPTWTQFLDQYFQDISDDYLINLE